MPVVERSTVIHATAEKVFKVIDDPQRLVEYMPGVVRVADIARSSQRVGDSYKVTYTVIGLRFPTRITVLEWEKNRRIVEKMEGGLPGTFTTTVQTGNGGTTVTGHVNYAIKGGVVGRVANRLLLERMNEKTMERFLENLKLLCEAA
ncbi:MAG: SRPBCC family protein [Chloroflexi bacterium]|nr:SRPBCC family protein [Chloroflexota bacterium]